MFQPNWIDRIETKQMENHYSLSTWESAEGGKWLPPPKFTKKNPMEILTFSMDFSAIVVNIICAFLFTKIKKNIRYSPHPFAFSEAADDCQTLWTIQLISI